MKMEFGNIGSFVQAEVKGFIGLCSDWSLNFMWDIGLNCLCDLTCPEIHCEGLILSSNTSTTKDIKVFQNSLQTLISIQEKL